MYYVFFRIRSNHAFMYLPYLYVLGCLERFKLVAATGGVSAISVQRWLSRSRSPQNVTPYIHKWFDIVFSMTWKDVKKFFPKSWVKQRGHISDDVHVKVEIQPYFEFAEDQPVSLNTYMSDIGGAKNNAARASAAKKRPGDLNHIVHPA